MKSLWKRSLSLLLALVMILGMMPMNALTVQAEEVDEEHSLKNADGLIWLVKSDEGGASDAFMDKVEDLQLDDMIRTAIGETDSSKTVTYYYDGAYRDINDMWTFLKYPEMATAMANEIAAAVAEHQLVTVQVGGVNKKIAFRNILIVNINIPDVIIEGAGAPEDWEAQVEAALDNPQFTITHIEEMSLKLADAKLTVERLVEDYEWPEPGDEPLTVGTITITITADDDESVVMTEVGEVVLHETRGLFNVIFTSNGETLYDEILVEGDDMPVVEEPTRTYYEFEGWTKVGTEGIATIPEKVSENVTYDAKWVPELDEAPNGTPDGIADQEQDFTVIFTDGVEDKNIFDDQKSTLHWGTETPTFEPTREYYDFLGWVKNGVGEPGEADATVTDHVTYVAQWAPQVDNAPDGNPDGIADQEQKFIVRYTDGVEGKDVFTDLKYTLAYGAAIPTFTPSRTYYEFLGWDKEVAETVTDNVTYTAQWKALNDHAPNGGDGIADEEQSFTITYTDGVADKEIFEDAVHTVAYGKSTPFFTPDREYYTFLGWSPAVPSKVSDNATYTATWKPNLDVNNNGIADQEETFTITYTDGADGKYFAPVTHTVAWGEKTPTYSPAHEYYTFTGWTTDVAYLVKQDATYVAREWKAKVDNNNNKIADQEEKFTIRFFLEKDDTEPYAIIEQNGGVVSQLPTQPTKQGFEFVDWQTLGGVAIGSVKVSDHADYYAVWTSGSMVTYVVEYWDGETETFNLPATTDAYAQNPGFGDTDDTIWTPWHLEGSTTAFDFATVLSGNITLYCYYAPDANNNNIVDGTKEDPYVYYIFKHQTGIEMVNTTTVTKPEDVAYPVSNSDNQVFVKWVETVEKNDDETLVKYIYTPDFAVDRNNNEIADGTTADPYVYYAFMDSTGDSLALIEWLSGDPEVNPAVYESRVKLDATKYEKFLEWDDEKVEYNGYDLYVYTPVVIVDRNDNGIEDGTADDPYSYYVVKDNNGTELFNEDWLAGESVVNPTEYAKFVELGENQKILDWNCEITDLDEGGKKYIYTPNVITDRNDNYIDDGSEDDPYVYYVIKHGDQILLDNLEWLSGEDEPNMELYKQTVIGMLGEHEKFVEWIETESINDSGYKVITNVAKVITDRNDNNIQDGSEQDPFTYYLYLDHKGETVVDEARLASEGEILPDDVICPVDTSKFEVFVKWSEKVETGTDGYTVYKTYTAQVIIDENDNGTPDGEETDKVKIPMGNIPGFESEYENGKFVISGEKDGAYFEGIVEVTDANGKSLLKGDGTFTYNDETVIKVTPLWSEDGTKMAAYVSAIKVNGVEQRIYYKDYMASNKPMDDFALMMAVAPIDEATGNVLEIVYENVDLTEKDPHDKIELGKPQYTEEEIYNAVFAKPEYDADSVSILYKAREAGSTNVNLDYFYQRLAKLDPQAPEMVKGMLGALGRDTESTPVTWDEVWFDIESVVQGSSDAQTTTDAYIDEVFAGDPDIDTLVGNAIAIFEGIQTRVSESANLRSFASIDEGAKEVTEQIVVNYIDPDDRYFVDYETKVKIVETRLGTTIQVPASVTYTYGEFTNADLLAQATLTDENGNVVTGKLQLDHELYQNYVVGEYTVKVVLPQDNTYKANSKTFKLIIEKATPTITIESIEVKKGEEYDPTPVVEPAAAQIVHVIAGIDLNQLNIDLINGVVTNKDAGSMPIKAWISLPAFYQDVLPKVGIGDGFYTVDGIKQALSEDALGKELVDKLDPALASINSMLDMAEGMVVQQLGVNVDFTLSITFQKGAKPTEPGFYLNYAQIMDTTNYEEATAYGTLVITPFIALPNDGVDLVYSGINDAQNLFTFENDGKEKELKVVHNGKYVNAEITYYGLTTRIDPTLTTPVDPGVYVATAIYTTEENGSVTMVGSDVALVFINMTRANIEVDNVSEVYDGTAKYPAITIKDNSGKNIGGGLTVISGSVDEDVEGNAVGLDKLTGNVNIDFPADLDNAWNSFCAAVNVSASDTIRPSTVVKFLNWYNDQIDAKSKTIIDTLTSLQVNAETTQKALDMAKKASNKLKEQVEKLPDNVSLSFKDKNELKYTETGAYLFVGIITDPELIPDVNAGLMIIKSADTFEMYDTYVPYNGKAQNIYTDDQSARDNVTIIFDTKNNQVNFILDGTMTNVVKKALEAAGYAPKASGNAYAETIYEKGNAAADRLTDAIIDKIRETAVARIENRFPDKGEALQNALDALEPKLDNLRTKLSAKLKDLDKMNDETLVSINGQLPVNAGDYKFYGFDYDVAYTSATLHIMPIHIELDVVDADKIYSSGDPKFEVEPYYYSSKGVAPNAAAELEVSLPTGVVLGDLVNYEFKRAEGEDVDDYTLTLTASLKDTTGNYVLDTTKDTGVFTIKPLDVTVTATVEPGLIEIGETAEVTVKVTAGDKVIDVATDFTYDAKNFTRNGNVLTAKTKGEYIITPSISDSKNFNVINTVDAILTVENADVTVKAEISDNEVYIPEDNSDVVVTIKVLRDGKEITVGGVNNDSYTIKDAEGNETDLATALKTAGTYTITPDTSKIENGYTVTDTVEATLEVKNVDVIVKAEISDNEVYIPDNNSGVTVTVKVTDLEGNELTGTGLIGGYTITGAANLTEAMKVAGTYTITPNVNDVKGYNVKVESTTLEVKKVDVTVTVTVEPNEVIVGGDVDVTVTATDNRLTNIGYIVKDSAGEVVTLEDALANAGTYTIVPDTSKFENAYNITPKAAQLVVKPVEISVIEVTVKAEVNPGSVYIPENKNVEIAIKVLRDGKEITVGGVNNDSYTIKDAEGNETDLATALKTAGTYTITPDTSKIENGYTVTDTVEATLEVKNVDVIVKAEISNNEVYIPDNNSGVTVTVKVTDLEGNELTGTGLIGGYTITGAANLTEAMKVAGTYTITPNVNDVKGYNVKVESATLEVKNVDVIVKAEISDNEVYIPEDNSDVTVTIKVLRDGKEITVGGVNNDSYTIKDAEGNETDLATALKTAGTYTITPDTSKIENGYTVTDTVEATLEVKKVDATVTAAVNPAEVHVGETTTVTISADVTIAGLTNDSYIITDAEKNPVADLATALANVGTYTITPDTSAFEYAYNIDVVPATLTVLEPLWDVSFANMTLASSLAMNFAFEQGHETDWTGFYAKITKTYTDGRDDVVVTLPAEQWGTATINGIAHYTIKFDGVAAKEMSDNIYVTIYNADGKAESNTWIDSVRDYATRGLDDIELNTEEAVMLVDMLNYGAAAQKLFNYNTNDLANAHLTAEQKAVATTSVNTANGLVAGANYHASNLTLESEIRLNMAFTGVTEGMSARVTFTNHAGREIDETIALVIEGGFGVVRVNQIAVADGRTPVTVTIYNADGTVYGTATDSMESYIARASGNEPDNAELYEKIMMFSVSANVFLH